MKFKARLHNVELLSKLAQSVEKIGKSCVCLLTPRKIQLVLTSDITDGVQVWCGLNTASLFSDVICESLHNNDITFELNLDLLQRALKSAAGAQEVLLKLTKKNNLPFLTVHVELQSAQALSITQDVPIALYSPAQFAQLSEPRLPDPTVHIMLPQLRLLRSVVDRMKNISEHLTLQANMAGQLTVKVETDMVTLATFYKGLENPQLEGRSPQRPDESRQAEVRVDIKKFARFLYSYWVSPQNVICCMIPGRALVLHVILDDLYITYYLPVISHHVVHHR